ncbi:MAG: hypothetical protein F6K00_32050 [Leptolyngbya sp. SIOISBB]|nr:hypothetical protein [Leptolyngbya sp. SIOISBB]
MNKVIPQSHEETDSVFPLMETASFWVATAIAAECGSRNAELKGLSDDDYSDLE